MWFIPPVNRQRRLHPVVRERQALVGQLQSLLRDLGLARREPEPEDSIAYARRMQGEWVAQEADRARRITEEDAAADQDDDALDDDDGGDGGGPRTRTRRDRIRLLAGASAALMTRQAITNRTARRSRRTPDGIAIASAIDPLLTGVWTALKHVAGAQRPMPGNAIQPVSPRLAVPTHPSRLLPPISIW